jgi:hypothetical protein
LLLDASWVGLINLVLPGSSSPKYTVEPVSITASTIDVAC